MNLATFIFDTAQKLNFSIKTSFRNCKQISKRLRNSWKIEKKNYFC